MGVQFTVIDKLYPMSKVRKGMMRLLKEWTDTHSSCTWNVTSHEPARDDHDNSTWRTLASAKGPQLGNNSHTTKTKGTLPH